ncbi:MAG TPA: DUF423 domain-containing protein [Xanthobacteraceae bacterium]|nr:DUF423 domain-containing protein [Xanthobacteraceae bacterium]
MISTAAPTVLIAFAGLMGAAGVMLLAAGAHAAPGAGLGSAGQVLLFHAAAVVALAAAQHQGLLFRPLALAGAIGFILGASLFSADIALRALADHRLFPLAAPSGGIVLIASWLAVTAAALTALVRG